MHKHIFDLIWTKNPKVKYVDIISVNIQSRQPPSNPLDDASGFSGRGSHGRQLRNLREMFFYT